VHPEKFLRIGPGKPAPRRCSYRSTGQTDRRTDVVPLHRRSPLEAAASIVRDNFSQLCPHYSRFWRIVTQKTQKLFSQIVNKPQHCPHCLLPTAREPSVTDRLRSANKLPRIFVKTNGFKNAFISYSLNSLQCEWCFSYSSDCVMQPSSCHITVNWLID